MKGEHSLSQPWGSALMGNWEMHSLPAQLMLSQRNFWLTMSFVTEKPVTSTTKTIFVTVKQIHCVCTDFFKLQYQVFISGYIKKLKSLYLDFFFFSLHFFPYFSCTWGKSGKHSSIYRHFAVLSLEHSWLKLKILI